MTPLQKFLAASGWCVAAGVLAWGAWFGPGPASAETPDSATRSSAASPSPAVRSSPSATKAVKVEAAPDRPKRRRKAPRPPDRFPSLYLLRAILERDASPEVQATADRLLAAVQSLDASALVRAAEAALASDNVVLRQLAARALERCVARGGYEDMLRYSYVGRKNAPTEADRVAAAKLLCKCIADPCEAIRKEAASRLQRIVASVWEAADGQSVLTSALCAARDPDALEAVLGVYSSAAASSSIAAWRQKVSAAPRDLLKDLALLPGVAEFETFDRTVRGALICPGVAMEEALVSIIEDGGDARATANAKRAYAALTGSAYDPAAASARIEAAKPYFDEGYARYASDADAYAWAETCRQIGETAEQFKRPGETAAEYVQRKLELLDEGSVKFKSFSSAQDWAMAAEALADEAAEKFEAGPERDAWLAAELAHAENVIAYKDKVRTMQGAAIGSLRQEGAQP